MIKGLYSNFQFINNYQNVFIISDTHFNDLDMLEYFNYPSAEEEVKIINSKVGKNDLLICLGDVGEIEFVKKLKGTKMLVMGNHDSGASNYKREISYEPVYFVKTEEQNKQYEEIVKCWGHLDNPSDWAARSAELKKFDDMCIIEDFKKNYKDEYTNLWYEDGKINTMYLERLDKWVYYIKRDNCLFDYIFEGPVFISDKILLSHEPIDYPYALNIHGHDHSNWHLATNHINCCANVLKFTPVNLKHIIEAGYLKNIKDIHRNCIDEATRRKMKRNGNR